MDIWENRIPQTLSRYDMASFMRAVAQLGQAYNVSVIDVPTPTILNATDVVVRINASAICGSDLHNYHVATGSPDNPYLYGHEGIGYVTEVGDAVRNVHVRTACETYTDFVHILLGAVPQRR
jgi:threonine dehydrogenase-like Zn-dependent dehydrogenase